MITGEIAPKKPGRLVGLFIFLHSNSQSMRPFATENRLKIMSPHPSDNPSAPLSFFTKNSASIKYPL